ncbi:ParB/RepB/Spo0J family partition protein [Faecalicatena contorta]|uniref:ParB/RepB/Spo0J family partition protein n=2 Tax=Faecalicatena contorta TaxID=39482 RepID=A0A315ZZC2_9FIRM|nr:ParB/RepB/Spo0J family partition protein [Faecalicatena contorta]PWJ50855.1 ParB/RepB/Spo0J family partition protein [Faecalicatena contorta]SUQ13423.1 ParB/RepB/Spo0J family partition protein [Faecalicatena contorta]
MAKNRKNKPDDVKIIPENEAPTQEQTAPIEAAEIADSTPPPEMTAEEIVVLEHEGEAALHEVGNDGLEPPTSLDIPVPGDEVVSEEQKTEEVSDSILSPEVTTEETAALEHKEEIVSDEIGNDRTESPALDIPTPTDKIVSEEQEPAPHEINDNGMEPPITFNVPAPGDIVVSFDKINEIISEKKTTEEVEQNALEKDSLTEGEVSPEKSGKEVENTPSDISAEKSGKKTTRSDKQEKGSKTEKPTKDELSARGQKGAQIRKGRKQNVIDFLDGKSPTPFPGEKTTPSSLPEQPKESEEAPHATEPEQPQEPKEAPRSTEPEQIVYLKLSELYAFKDHPFQVRNDDEMAAMVESVKDKGVTQPAIVRPREDGGYEMVSGHRRQKASELAGFEDMPCIIRNLTDEQAITQMVEDNTNQRENILPSERAKALQMQLEAIKQQGVRTGNGQRSNEVVAERNKMTVKQVQRYIKLNELVPDLLKMVDEKKIAFTPAVELAFIKPKNQKYIAIAIEGQQSAPSLSQAQRMRDLDQKKLLNPDMIDGIMLEEKKEVDKVILSSQELGQYFGKEKTPREMKDTIMKLLEENKDKLKDISAPEKKSEQEK